MTTVTIEKLGTAVGAEVLGADCDRLLNDDAFPAWCVAALEANGALVFRGLHIDDETQVAFSKKLGRVEVFGKGERPEIFRVSLDPAKNPRADYLRGTFDWPTRWPSQAVRPSSPARMRPTKTSPTTRRSATSRFASSTRSKLRNAS